MKKILLCWSTCFKKVALVQIPLFWTSSFVNKSSCSDKVTVLKNCLFSITGCSVEVSLWTSSYSEKNNCRKETIVLEKGFLKKSSCSEEIAAPKKELLCQSNYSEEMWRSSFSRNKAVLKIVTTYAIREIVLAFSWNDFLREVFSPI